MSAQAKVHDARPWYCHLWPWLLMLPPALSVAGGVAMVYLATHTSSALVVDDYAHIEALTDERFDRDGRAAELGLSATIEILAAPDRVELSLTASPTFTMPADLSLRLQHAADPLEDRRLTLLSSGGFYSAPVDLRPGRYRIELMPADGSWRLGGVGSLPGSSIALTPPVESTVQDSRGR
jgi:hypothetical protein